MKQSLGAQTFLYPCPVLLVGTYDQRGRPNIMTAAWGGVCCSDPPCVAVSLRAATHSHGSIVARRAFTLSIPSEEQVREADFAGIYSGREVDKFEALGLTPVRSTLVDAPYVEECPMVLECTLRHTFELGLHTQFVGQVMDVKLEEEAAGPDGAPDIERVRPVVYAQGNRAYYSVGRRLGRAFSVGRRAAE